MSPLTILLPLVALLAATALPVQAALNAQLARGVGNPILAGAISFAAAAILLAGIVGLFVRDYPSAEQWSRVPLWLFVVGGALGAVYVCANIVLVPRLGAATLIAFAIAGQLIAALLLDQFGLLGLAMREISLGRVAGVALVLVGAVMVRVL
ncbi:DMT family transporter [Alsobacter sp. KACC 23698]|uniref:DMT family transporter n=1 Tax=Alsobacter sp. KACC 23698 TaxID=3149229 RepID=A0AAU7JF61_9HYPH